MPSLLVLWDVDYTLINAGGVGKYLYELVFRDMFGRDMPGMAHVDGRTDRAIILDTLAQAGVAEPRRHVDDFLARMAARAPALSDVAKERVRPMPGAAAALAALADLVTTPPGAPGQTVVAGAARLDQKPPLAAAGPEWAAPSVSASVSAARTVSAVRLESGARTRSAARPVFTVQSVLTGNIRPLAEVKLRAPRLAGHLDLDVGAFGDQHEVRAELVHVARRNAARAYGRVFAGEETVLVGDTPLDVTAALVTGARAVGVATGRSTAEDLAEAGAHAVLPDLTDTAAVISALLPTR